MKRIRKTDTVIVTTGKSKGTINEVLKCTDEFVVVKGANLITKHVKPNPSINKQGGIETKEAKIHISNVAIYNPNTNKADKVGFKFIEKDGKKHKVRYFKSNNELIDIV